MLKETSHDTDKEECGVTLLLTVGGDAVPRDLDFFCQLPMPKGCYACAYPASEAAHYLSLYLPSLLSFPAFTPPPSFTISSL